MRRAFTGLIGAVLAATTLVAVRDHVGDAARPGSDRHRARLDRRAGDQWRRLGLRHIGWVAR